MSDTITCEFCAHDFAAELGRCDCPNCLGGSCAVCTDCNRVCDPTTCAMPACPHKPDD